MPILPPKITGDPVEDTWNKSVTDQLNDLEVQLQTELEVNDVVSQNYDGSTDLTADINDYVQNPGPAGTGTEGYFLNAEAGVALFNDAVVRGGLYSATFSASPRNGFLLDTDNNICAFPTTLIAGDAASPQIASQFPFAGGVTFEFTQEDLNGLPSDQEGWAIDAATGTAFFNTINSPDLATHTRSVVGTAPTPSIARGDADPLVGLTISGNPVTLTVDARGNDSALSPAPVAGEFVVGNIFGNTTAFAFAADTNNANWDAATITSSNAAFNADSTEFPTDHILSFILANSNGVTFGTEPSMPLLNDGDTVTLQGYDLPIAAIGEFVRFDITNEAIIDWANTGDLPINIYPVRAVLEDDTGYDISLSVIATAYNASGTVIGSTLASTNITLNSGVVTQGDTGTVSFVSHGDVPEVEYLRWTGWESTLNTLVVPDGGQLGFTISVIPGSSNAEEYADHRGWGYISDLDEDGNSEWTNFALLPGVLQSTNIGGLYAISISANNVNYRIVCSVPSLDLTTSNSVEYVLNELTTRTGDRIGTLYYTGTSPGDGTGTSGFAIDTTNGISATITDTERIIRLND